MAQPLTLLAQAPTRAKTKRGFQQVDGEALEGVGFLRTGAVINRVRISNPLILEARGCYGAGVSLARTTTT